MSSLTKAQQRERFIAEFLCRLREAAPGTRVYMAVGDLFEDAGVESIDEREAACGVAGLRDDDDDERGDAHR